MKVFSTILVAFLAFLPHLASACDCESQGEFLTVAPNAKLVALVRVTKYLTFKDIYDESTPQSMQVEIVEVYNGSENRKTITVWGDDGNLCRPYLNRFDVGEYYVIAFDHAGISYNKEEKADDFAISICGEFWLKANMKDKTAKGLVTKAIRTISFSEIEKLLSAK